MKLQYAFHLYELQYTFHIFEPQCIFHIIFTIYVCNVYLITVCLWRISHSVNGHYFTLLFPFNETFNEQNFR